MVTQFQRGQKSRLSDLTLGTDLYVGVQITGPGMVFDISCFGLDADERLSDDRYFVFYNQPKSPEESLQLLGAQAGDTESFRVTLDRVPAAIHRLAFTATIDGDGTMAQAAPGYLRIVAGGEEVARYSFDGSAFTTERAVMLGDFYRKDGWRFAAVGQGFDGGLAALLRHFGGEVEEEEPAAQAGAAAQPVPGFAPPGAAPEPVVPGFAPPGGAQPPVQVQPPAQPQPPVQPQPQPPAPAQVQPPAQPQPPVQPQATQPLPAQTGQPTYPPAGHVPAPPQAPYQPVPPQQPPHQPFPPQHTPPAAPYGAQPPGGFHGAPPPGAAAGGGLRGALQKYAGTAEHARWTQQNPQLVRADLGIDGQPVLARQGSMVLYQGDVEFGYKGAGIRGRMTRWATGEGMPALMRCTGTGRVHLAEEAARLHPVELQGDAIVVASQHVLAFDESLSFEVRRIDGHGIPGGSLFALQFQGHGTLVLTTHGEPLVLPVTNATFADANAVVAWSAAAQVLVANQVRVRRQAFPGHTGETTQLQFRGAPGNFAIIQPYEI
ncbi:TerD family protein [Streptomyces sp. RFCAC02]|uniref:TerD family protein n=1 Tax=Streptomyces sp. RFCAC02 TaxID=2499143 RepID=UPI0010209DD9|nr:TerD family protein [Streptomyces sp. RFCAC02]